MAVKIMTRYVINNFLPRDEFIQVKNSILNETFPWTVQPKTSAPESTCDDRYNLQFVHMFYHSPITISPQLSLINPILKKLSHSLMIRIKANITTCANTIHVYGYHTDLPDSLTSISKTAIFYLNTNDGFTEFETDKQRFSSVENSLLVFDSSDRHSGTNCTDQKYRAVINFNFV